MNRDTLPTDQVGRDSGGASPRPTILQGRVKVGLGDLAQVASGG